MQKQTKNIITREWVEKELRFYNTADIRSCLVVCSSVALVFIPLTVLCVYGTSLFFKNIFVKILSCILIGVLISCPVWLNLLSLRGFLAEKKRLANGDFEIVTREVLYKSEKLVHRHIEEFLHFKDFKEISVGHTDFQLASAGDLFYLIHYKGEKSISLFYSCKMYEYREH